MKSHHFGSMVFVVVVSLAQAAHAAPTSDGSILFDDFLGSSLNADTWEGTAHSLVPFGGSDGTLTISGGLAQIQSTDLNTMAFLDTKLGVVNWSASPNEWVAAIRFRVDGDLNSAVGVGPNGTSNRQAVLLQGSSDDWVAGDTQEAIAIDLRLTETDDDSDGIGPNFNLGWHGYDGVGDDRQPELLAGGLDKGVFYTLTAHRKSDDMVDLYLDGALLATKGLLVGMADSNFEEEIPDFVRIASDPSGATSLNMTVDYVTIGASESVAVPGDFDGDGDVDGADFVVWQTNFPKAEGGTLDTGDADADGDVDGADFVVWQTNFPTSPGSAGVAAVPEPNALLLAIAGAIGVVLTRSLRKQDR